MEFFDLEDGFSINLEYVKAIRKTASGTKIYLDIDGLNDSIESTIPFEVIKMVIGMKKKSNNIAFSPSAERSLDQLAKFQTQHVG